MLNPHDLSKLAVGPARVLYAPLKTAVPKKLQSIVKLTNAEEYEPVGEWEDFGSAPGGDGASYSRGFETEGLEIEQVSGAIFNEITDVNRSIGLNVAEISPENMKIVEGTEIASEAVAAEKSVEEKGGAPAQTRVAIGSVSELPLYRIALIAQRKKSEVEVVEPDGTVRAGLVAVVLNRCSLAADDSEIQVQKGGLLSAPITFEAFPEPGEEPDEAFGGWIFESAGTIE